MENTSGQGATARVPNEIRRWNWGAFFLNWIWGIGNSTFIALICLIPGVVFIMAFVLGAKGSEWAWRNKRWDSIEQFKRIQQYWAVVGAVLFIGGILFITLFVAIFFFVTSLMKSNDAYRLAMTTARQHPQIVRYLGEPIRSGYFVQGKINVSDGSGQARLTIPLAGPNGDGKLRVEAFKRLGRWQLQSLVFVGADGQRIELLTETKDDGGGGHL